MWSTSRTSLIVLVLALAVLAAPGARAAAMQQTVSDETNIIAISGRILKDDHLQFARLLVPAARRTVVVLDSLGGNVQAAIGIGEQIRAHGWSTLVPANRICASACALVWLAGNNRYAGSTSRIGFHAAYSLDDHSESGIGNAMIGAYLTRLGLSYQVVAFVTSSPPDQLRWLNDPDASRVGITYAPLPRQLGDVMVNRHDTTAAASVTPADPHVIPMPTPPVQTSHDQGWHTAQVRCQAESQDAPGSLLEAFAACMRHRWLSGTDPAGQD